MIVGASRKKAETTKSLRERLTATEAELEAYRRAVAEATRVCRDAAQGNLEPRVLHIDVKGDLGEMLHCLNHLLDMTDAFVREAQASLEYAGGGRFYRRFLLTGMRGSFRHGADAINGATEQLASKTQMLQRAQADRLALADDFESAVKGLVENVAAASTQLHATATTLVTAAQRTTADSAKMAAASIEASQNMDTVAAATEEVSSTLVEIDRQARLSHEIARDAEGKTDHAAVTMGTLDQSSRQIGRVVKAISQIAEQTKLLALNAGIEAARGGEAGKGFAVVANEVKNLAAEAAEASQQISQQVNGMCGAANGATQAIQSVARTVHEMNEISAAIRGSVGEQRQAATEISRSIQNAAENTRDVTLGINVLSEATRETSTAADQVRYAAAELSKLAESLRAEVEDFLHVVRAEIRH